MYTTSLYCFPSHAEKNVMPIVRVSKHKNNYIIIDRTGLEDERLSYRARGLLAYLITKPDDWEIRLEGLAKGSPKEGREAVAAALIELEKTGYATKKLTRHTTGKIAGWVTTIYEDPTEIGKTEIGKTEIGKTEIGPSQTNTPETSVSEHSTENGFAEFGKPPSLGDYKKNLGRREKKDPPIAPPKSKKSSSASLAHEVLAYLNEVHGRGFENSSQIQTLLATGVSLEDCKLVIDWLFHVERLQNPEGYQKYADNVTPFRPLNFDRNREKARRWKAQQSAPPMHQPFRLVT